MVQRTNERERAPPEYVHEQSERVYIYVCVCERERAPLKRVREERVLSGDRVSREGGDLRKRTQRAHQREKEEGGEEE